MKISGEIVTVETKDKKEEVNLLEQILMNLKKIEYHLSIASDINLNDQDV